MQHHVWGRRSVILSAVRRSPGHGGDVILGGYDAMLESPMW